MDDDTNKNFILLDDRGKEIPLDQSIFKLNNNNNSNSNSINIQKEEEKVNTNDDLRRKSK